ncbi:MAG: helix-turn-helix domain-containing protein [Lachnospiraceae bacterium]
MISSQVIRSSIEELKTISKVDLCVWDLEGKVVATTFDAEEISTALIEGFVQSPADSQVIGMHHLLKVLDEDEVLFILDAKGSSEEAYMLGKIAVSQLQHLIVAYKERYDRNNFFQNLLLDNMLLVDIYNRAKKLHIEAAVPRAVFLIETDKEKEKEKDFTATELLNGMFSMQVGDYITAVDENNVILIKELAPEDDYLRLEQVANTIVDMMNMEAMMNVRVAYGTIVGELKEVSKSYKEAKMALDVGKIFYAEKKVSAYNTLGIGRLIYQLPINLCRIFIDEIFGSNIPSELDDETLTTINKFFENNLNVSETSRQLFVHRNTLVYRIEKLEMSTGLDIRTFEDALTFKIALMVVNYMKYLDSLDY